MVLEECRLTFFAIVMPPIIMKSLDPLRAKKIFIRKKLGHTAVSAIKASSVTLQTWQKEPVENTVNLKKWGTYWFRLVRMYVCTYSCSRYRLETSCMDSSWKNSRRIFLVFLELSPLVKLRPFDKQGDEIL